MFVRNSTPHQPVLARGYLLDDLAVGSINVELVFELGVNGALTVARSARGSGLHDPPDIRRVALWRGCSLTVSGHARGPDRGPFIRQVKISAGDRSHRLLVFGERRWIQRNGKWTPTDPEPFEAVPLSWDRAFGGRARLAPGFFPGTELPHPGGTVAYHLNPDGMGFCLDSGAAQGLALPQVEAVNQRMHNPLDTPVPAGCAPCAALPQLRMVEMVTGEDAVQPDTLSSPRHRVRRMLHAALRMKHHAPAPLIFARLEAGTPVVVSGVGDNQLRFVIPRPHLHVSAIFARGSVLVAQPRLRSLHLDADRRLVRLVWGYLFRYSPPRAPRRVEVREAA